MTIKSSTRPNCPVPTKPTPIPRCPPRFPIKPAGNGDGGRFQPIHINKPDRDFRHDRFEAGPARKP